MSRILILVIFILGGLLLFKFGASSSALADGDTLMRGFYYSLWGLLVASGILASQRNLGESLRNLAIWTLIVLGLVTAYLYRNDAQNFASRLTAGLVPGHAAVITEEDGFSTVLLYKAGNGHYQADVSIDGRMVSMMVDTGASSVALTYEDAERIGLNPAALAFSDTVMTANGPAQMASVVLSDVSIGGITRTNVRAGIAERGKLDRSLLGMSFLGTLTSVMMSGDELRLKD